jgi:integrase
MPVYFDKKRGRYRFEFDRVINYQRVRATKLLPKAWSQAQADKFDREESARLYAIAQGIEQEIPKIDLAVRFYLDSKKHLKSFGHAISHLAAGLDFYEGKLLNQLPDVSQAMREAWDGKLQPATIKQRIALVRAACRFYWKEKRLNIPDPASHVILPEVKNDRHEYVTRKQALQLARACQRREARALILIAFYSGMRKGEMWSAKVVGSHFVLPDTKNGERRMVPIVPKVAHYARKHLPPDISYRSLMIWFRKAADEIGQPGLHLHDLRHSTASAMIQRGVPLYVVGKVLGHKSPRSTARYSHLATENLSEALSMIAGKGVGKS